MTTADYTNAGQFQGGSAHPSAQREAPPKDIPSFSRASKRARQVSAGMTKARRQTAEHVHLTLSAVPPSVNNMFANVAGKGRVKSREYKAWRSLAVAELRMVQRAPLIAGRVRIRVAIERPNAASDLSNRLKAIEDALVEANVIEDDRLIEGYDRFEWAPIQGVEIEVRAAP